MNDSRVSFWGWAWRLFLLATTIAFYVIPYRWYDSARHFGAELFILVPLVNLAIWIGPLIALIDTVRYIVLNRRSNKRPQIMLRLAWATIVISPFVRMLISEWLQSNSSR